MFFVSKFYKSQLTLLKNYTTKVIKLKKPKMSQEFEPSSAQVQTFVFLDLETTGLLAHQGRNCRIVELSFVAVLRDHLLFSSSRLPRILNKLTLCFNPMKTMNDVVTSIHGMSNEMMEKIPPLSHNDYTLISTFLSRLPGPVCLVAHNGTHFDFPLLKSELHRLGEALPNDLQCIDSLQGFRSQLKLYLDNRDIISEVEKLHQYDDLLNDGNDEFLFLAAEQFETLHNDELDISLIKPVSQTEFELANKNKLKKTEPSGSLYWRQKENERTPRKPRKYYSYKLNEIYKILHNQDPVNNHRAENDVMNLIECVHTIGEPFIEWMDKHSYNFENVRVYY